MRIFEEIRDKVYQLEFNGIAPSVIIIGIEKMGLLSAEENYIKNWLTADSMTLQVNQYKMDIIVDKKNAIILRVLGDEKSLSSARDVSGNY